MDLPKIYTIQAFDAPQHTERLRNILQEVQTEDRIGGFTVLKPAEDLSTLAESVNDEDMILIVLTDDLEAQRAMIEKKIRDLSRKIPGLRVAEILVDNIVYDNDFITFPDDLRPIRNREDMDEAWSSIARSLRDMFPVKQKKKAKPFPMWIVFVVLGVFLFGALLIFILPSANGEETRETFTTVPDLAGMNGTDAISMLINTGLETGEHSVESHDTVEKDLVIRTEPNAGESIKKGDRVNLILSGGRGQIPVPEVAGVTPDRAKVVLEGAGLRVGQQRSERSDQVEQGRVIRSDPLTGREVDLGSQVNLVISGGREQIRVPDLAGTTLERAIGVLEGAGFRVGRQPPEYSDQVEQGRVIRTDPSAGSDADRGSQINLVTSLGKYVALSAPTQLRTGSKISTGGRNIFETPGVRVDLIWNAVTGAASYSLELVDLPRGQTCSQINDSYNVKINEDIRGTSFTYSYSSIRLVALSESVCWRVYAVSSNGINGAKSNWSQLVL